MITSTAFAGKHYAVLGLARSGRATVDALLASGARVTAWDSNPEAIQNFRLSRAQSRDAGAGVSTSLDTNGLEFADLDKSDLTQFDSIVVTPGLPLNRHPIAARAKAAGVEIIGDIELFARARAELPPHKVVGITGTNGKSTTTALVHHILREAGVPTLMGGNIGLPILSADPLPEGGVYVLELSSYQLDLTQSLDCDVAVLLNITPDHLDRYDSFSDYANSKIRLFHMQWIDDLAIAPSQFFHGDDELAGVVNDGKSGTVHALDEMFLERRERPDAPVAEHQSQWPALQGPHNLENVRAAIGVSFALGILGSQISAGLRTFSGLPHRTERVREKDGVLFVNDSKATNPTATAPALAAYPAVRWILGGQAKSNDLDECAPSFGHVSKAYTIGEASALFASLLKPYMAVAECGTLDAAVKAAAADAQPGDTVLLSPACASFDQFANFEARGEAFRAAVEAL